MEGMVEELEGRNREMDLIQTYHMHVWMIKCFKNYKNK